MKNSAQRDYSLDILRIIACVMVVGIHTAMEGWYNISPRTYTWTVLNFYDTLFRPGVPLFIMISGALFLGKERIDIKRLWTKNILRLGVIYLVWAIFYAVMSNGIHKALAEPSIIWNTVFGSNPQYHLWYLRTLMQLYAISPLLWVLIRAMNGKLTRYYLILFAIFGILCKTVFELPFIPTWLHDQINLFSGMDLMSYGGYFILGYFLTEPACENRFPRSKLRVVYIVTLLLAAGVNQLIAVADNWPTQALYGNFSLPVTIESICIFLLIRSRFSDPAFSEKQMVWLERLSISTLFVYLIHPFMIQRLEMYLHFSTTNYNVLLSVPLTVLVVYALSSVCGLILERIPGIRFIV